MELGKGEVQAITLSCSPFSLDSRDFVSISSVRLRWINPLTAGTAQNAIAMLKPIWWWSSWWRRWWRWWLDPDGGDDGGDDDGNGDGEGDGEGEGEGEGACVCVCV